MDGGISFFMALAAAGTSVYSTKQAANSQKAAAEFNAEQARNAAKVKADDDRGNSLRRQEENRKYLASVRASMLQDSNSIEGGDADFLDEAEGNLQLRVLDQAAASNREQARYANAAFQYDWQGEQAEKAGNINTASAVISGFNSTYAAGKQANYWGQTKSGAGVNETTKTPSSI